MGSLTGLHEYLGEHYSRSLFEQIAGTQEVHCLRIHGRQTVCGRVLEDMTYDISFQSREGVQEILQKTSILYLYPIGIRDSLAKLVKTDPEVEKLGLQPIIPAAPRNHIKNKTLFPLMKERTVVFFTMLEGDLLRGVVSGFSRYEILLHLKGGIPVTLLRHGIHDLRDKRNRCFLKKTQERSRDWEKSAYYVSD